MEEAEAGRAVSGASIDLYEREDGMVEVGHVEQRAGGSGGRCR